MPVVELQPRTLTESDIVEYTLTYDQSVLIYKYAKSACIGGVSRIHTDPKERARRLLADNICGMTGNLFGNYHLDGNYDSFVASREQADRNPRMGDGGQDRIGCGLDFKCSFMRSSDKPLNYSMLVRPRERHPGWVYVQFLIGATELTYNTKSKVYLVGWAGEQDLPNQVEQSGTFEGAFRIPARQLRPINPFPEYLTGLE